MCGVLCATRITGALFFSDIIKSQQYVTHILTRFLSWQYNFLIKFYALFREYNGDITEVRGFGHYIHEIKPYATLL
jgi:hypothetical protein